MGHDRYFIEETFPVKDVGAESAREKNIRHGHISTLHIWWARWPLASSRATAYAALTPPLRYPHKDKQFFEENLIKAQRFGQDYYLYVVLNAANKPELYIIQDLANQLKSEEYVNGIYKDTYAPLDRGRGWHHGGGGASPEGAPI